MEEEIWKDIKGYEGLYQVSNEGRVKSLSRTIIKSDKTINTKDFGLPLRYSPTLVSSEYSSIIISLRKISLRRCRLLV